MADNDGDLSNVNPELLRLCANPEDWREQRRRAMKAKIFGNGAQVDSSAAAETYLPMDRTAGPSPSSAPQPSVSTYAGQQAPVSKQAAESYILQQLLSHKRHREETNTQQASAPARTPQLHPQPPPPTSQGHELSLKEKLMRKYRRD
ncbi:hypothetical protein Q4I32_007760 [Leishmania shawi]|uniref:Uncharacterized protein n=1 Tax=Leishmania shawi TaxID=5680 RepID=A0AAW3B536_9TRYP